MQKNMIFVKPKKIIIGDNEYAIKTDFKTWIKFDLLIQDEELKNDIYVLFHLVKKLIFIEEPGGDAESVFRALFFFQAMNRDIKPYTGKQSKDRVYDFQSDWPYIFAAFMQQYHINLYDTDLHWFEFKALFDCLKGTRFNDITDIRGTDISDIEESKRLEFKHVKDYYALNDHVVKRKAKDIENAILQRIGGESNDN